MTIYRKGTVRFIWLFVLVTFMLLLPSQMLAQTLITSHTGLQDTDGNYVYMNQGVSAEFCTPPGAVLRTPVTGGEDQLLYEECGFAPYYVRVDGAQAYILDWQDDEILRLPIAGGTPVKIADTDGAVFVRGFDTDADFVYWADEIGIRQTYKTGIGTMTLATPSPDDSFRSLTVDDTYVYYLVGWFDDYELRRVPKAGGAAQVLHADSAHCWTVHSLMVDDDTLYWAEGLCDAPNVIKYMPKDGSATPAVLYAGNPTREVTGLELVANLLLFTESQHPSSVSETSGKVRYMNKSGGAISDLVTNLTLPRGLISDGRYAFWSDRNDWVGGVGGTKQNPLPPVDMDGDGFDQTIDCDDNNPAVTVGNTCVSESSVTIEDGSGDASVTFPEITAGGTTTVTVGSCTPGSVEGITLVPTAPICVDINTDATFTPPAMVCIHYDDTGMTLIEEANLRMVHCDDIGNCDLLTCSPPEPVDTVNNVVCGCADSFSTFALGTPLDSDNDLVFDLLDNCPLTPNTFQEDKDEDGIGDACDFFDFEIFLPLLLGFGS